MITHLNFSGAAGYVDFGLRKDPLPGLEQQKDYKFVQR